MRLSHLLLELLFPRRCPVCDGVQPLGQVICPSCADSLQVVRSPFCRKCGKPLANERQEYCGDCAGEGRYMNIPVSKSLCIALNMEAEENTGNFMVQRWQNI